MNMFVTIINDCKDQNALGRQETLLSTLFPNTHITSIGIEFGNTIEAAGNLIDILGIAGSTKGIVLVNSAPRHRGSKKWPNGTPFAYFAVNNVIVISTVDEYTLSLVKKLKLVDSIRLLSLDEVIAWAIRTGKLDNEKGKQIKVSQFRSLEFSPRVAQWLGWSKVPSKKYDIQKIENAPNCVWLIDAFGNCKTTLLPKDSAFNIGARTSPASFISTKGALIKYNYLKDVPKGEMGLIQGSSGMGDKKFLEIVINGGNAAKKLNLKVGDLI